jgi:hypothetical protein
MAYFRNRIRGALLAAAVAAAALAAAVVSPQQAFAAPSAAELASARETYREGIALEAAGNWAGALAKFQAVAAIKSAPRVRFHIGLCQEKLGRWNEAVGAYKMASLEATRERASDVVKEADAAWSRLKAKIPVLTLRRGAGADSATVTLDGVELGASTIGTEMPLDPGVHTLEVSMAGAATRRTTFELKEGERKDVEVQRPEPESAQPAAATPVAPVATSAPGGETAPPPAKGSSAVPWLVTGVGAAGLAASGVFFYLRQGAITDLQEKCGPELQCTEAERSIYDRGRTYTLAANIALGVGIAGVGVGTVLLLTRSGKPAESARRAPQSTSVGVSFHPAGVNLVGRF